MEDIIEVKIVLDEEKKVYELQKGVSGKVVVRSNVDSVADTFGIDLQYQQRGKLSAKDMESKRILLGRGIQWKVGRVYEYQFDNIYPDIPTYQGVNGSLSWQLITYLKFSAQTRSKLQNKYLRKFKILKSINPEMGLYANLPLIFTDNRPFQFPTQSGFLQFQNEYVVIYIMLLVLIIFTAFATELPCYFYVAIVAILGIAFLIHTYFVELLLGKIKVKILQSKNRVKPTISLDKGLQRLSRVRAAIHIIEMVTDRRGTSESVYREHVYNGILKELSPIQPITEFELPIPPSKFPPDFKCEDIELKWEIYFLFTLKNGFDIALIYPLRVSR